MAYIAVPAVLAICAFLIIQSLIAKQFGSTPLLPNKADARKQFTRAAERTGDRIPTRREGQSALQEQLSQAGISFSPSGWKGLQLFSACIGVILALVIFAMVRTGKGALCALLVAAAGILLPSAIKAHMASKRRYAIKRDLPSTVELLSVVVRSGYPLARGIKLVGGSTTGPLAEELRKVDTDVNLLGMDLPAALSRMSKRCDVPEVTSFSNSISHASKQGTSVSRVLSSQARLARDAHYAALLEEVNKLPGKMVPLTFLIMLLIIVLALTPPIYNTLQLLMANSSSITGVVGGFQQLGL